MELIEPNPFSLFYGVRGGRCANRAVLGGRRRTRGGRVFDDRVKRELRWTERGLAGDGVARGVELWRRVWGELFGLPRSWERIEARELPEAPWPVTDDTMMAISVIEALWAHGEIREEWLATHFARMYDPMRGYGAAMHGLLGRIGVLGGAVWREEAGALFGGRGSFGNGSAMRVAPLGAFFADDLDRLVVEAGRSAATTHAHGEAAAGAIAVALGAAIAWRGRNEEASGVREFLAEVQMRVPPSEVRDGIGRAMELPDGHAGAAGRSQAGQRVACDGDGHGAVCAVERGQLAWQF